MYGYESDIFSLGKIYLDIIQATSFKPLDSILYKLKALASKMTDSTMKNRPSLKDILKLLSMK